MIQCKQHIISFSYSSCAVPLCDFHVTDTSHEFHLVSFNFEIYEFSRNRYNGTNQENCRDNYSILLPVVSEKGEEVDLIIDAYEFQGGFCALINDYRRCVDARREQENDVRMINIQFVHVVVCGDPMLLAVATKPIPAGTPLLCDYGKAYWARVADYRQRQSALDRHLEMVTFLGGSTGTPHDPVCL